MAYIHIKTIIWYDEYRFTPIDKDYYFDRKVNSRLVKYLNYLKNSEYYFEDKNPNYMGDEFDEAFDNLDFMKVIQVQKKRRERYEGNDSPSARVIINYFDDKELIIKHYYRPGYLLNSDKGMELFDMLKKDEKSDSDNSENEAFIVVFIPIALTIILLFIAPMWGIIMLIIILILYGLVTMTNKNI